MAGMDKFILMEKLRTLGWRDAGDKYHMEPPQELFDKRSKSFYVYDAESLQDLLGDPVPIDEPMTEEEIKKLKIAMRR
jgi:hypothetical protein